MKNFILSKINALAITMLIAGTVSAQNAPDYKRGEIGLRYMPTFSKWTFRLRIAFYRKHVRLHGNGYDQCRSYRAGASGRSKTF